VRARCQVSEERRTHRRLAAPRVEAMKARYRDPYGDFELVRRCAVLSAESRAGQYKRHDIQNAVAHLHGMIDALART
jgi:hypothetical protein